MLNAFSARGVRLSVDDFGTGYSALSYLKRFPFDVLKIDGSFIAGLVENSEDAELTRAIVAMSHALGLTVLAECVETQAQAEILIEYGCDLAQGYCFSRPLPPEEFRARLGEGPGAGGPGAGGSG